MKLFPLGSEALAQVLGKGHRVPPRGIETLLLAHSISVNSRLVFEVEGDRAEYLGQSQSLEFSQDRFGGKSFIEALDDGIERYASACQIVSTVAFFDVFFRDQPNYSRTSWLDDEACCRHGRLHVFGTIRILAMPSGGGTTATKPRGTGESAYSTLIQKHLPCDVQ
jgi:hypothetical protein